MCWLYECVIGPFLSWWRPWLYPLHHCIRVSASEKNCRVTGWRCKKSLSIKRMSNYRQQLVRTCARYHQEQKRSEERSKQEKQIQLRHIASTIAREVEFFWSNIEQVCALFIYHVCTIASLITIFVCVFFPHQVVEIKLQFEIYEKKLKSLCIQKTKGMFSSLCLKNSFPPLKCNWTLTFCLSFIVKIFSFKRVAIDFQQYICVCSIWTGYGSKSWGWFIQTLVFYLNVCITLNVFVVVGDCVFS